MRKPTRPRDVGRGERVLPGAWRLRLPLELPGVPHVNAWALDAGDGIVLVDTGMHEKGSMRNLERALLQAGRTLEEVGLVVITHAHPDHCGEAATIAARAGCEVWMHPAYTLWTPDPEQSLARSVEIARQSGVPEAALQRWAERRSGHDSGIAGVLHSDRDLLAGVRVETDLGVWEVHETPGHSPSHVVLHQPERRLLISGDHLLGRVSQYFELGHTPDPVGEFLRSLDLVEGLGARLVLAGHARPFTDVRGHAEANRALIAEQLDAVRGQLAGGPRTAFAIARAIYAESWSEDFASWLLTRALAWLIHLEALGEAARERDGTAETWFLH